MRILNALIGWLQFIGVTQKRLDVNSILRKAQKRTGLTDTGGELFRLGADALVASINKEPTTHFGKLSSTGFGVEGLSNRLLLVDYLKKHPKVAENKIERPVFIVGFPRTGTTLLQNLLALSDDRRALPFWEIANPIPLSDDPKKDVARRQRRTKLRLAIANFVVPEMKFIHEVRFDSLEECWSLMIPQFTIMNYDMTGRWPDYGKWMLQTDMVGPYKEYRKFLQVMADRVPNRKLILKCPDHMWFLDELVEVFPDACIVWTHRDPAESVPSYCSLASLNWRLLYGQFDPKELGPYIQERFNVGIERGLAARARLGEDRFIDVDFRDVIQDPISVVNAITERFGLSRVSEDAMRAYLSLDRPDDRGKHKYTAEHYGLSESGIRTYFREYISRFNVAVKG